MPLYNRIARDSLVQLRSRAKGDVQGLSLLRKDILYHIFNQKSRGKLETKEIPPDLMEKGAKI
jgi:hypothetical protein